MKLPVGPLVLEGGKLEPWGEPWKGPLGSSTDPELKTLGAKMKVIIVSTYAEQTFSK